jgi:predicted Fe-S protein YdhL (DUF1289 family)
MSTPVKSPCIDVCRFAGPNGWCVACGRTLDEARTWRKLSPFARKRVLKELPRRLLRMEKAP